MNRPFLVPEHDRPQVHFLDEPALAVDDRDIADAALILEDEEESGDDVAHDRLCAEADGEPRDAGAGERGRDVDTQLAQDHQPGDGDDEHRQRLLQQAAERLRALGALDDVEARAAAHLPLEAPRRRGTGADDEVRRDRDDHDPQPGAEQPAEQRVGIAAEGHAIARERQRRRHERRRRDQEDEELDDAARTIDELFLDVAVLDDGVEDGLREARHELREQVRQQQRQPESQRHQRPIRWNRHSFTSFESFGPFESFGSFAFYRSAVVRTFRTTRTIRTLRTFIVQWRERSESSAARGGRCE